MSSLGIGEPPEVEKPKFYIFPACKNMSCEQCPGTASDLTCAHTCHNYNKAASAEEAAKGEELAEPGAQIDPNVAHEYVGQGVDIGVGEQFEPCHICGDDYESAIHQDAAAKAAADAEATAPALDGTSGKVIEVDGQPAVVKARDTTAPEKPDLTKLTLQELVMILVERQDRVTETEDELEEVKAELKLREKGVREIVNEFCRRGRQEETGQQELPL